MSVTRISGLLVVRTALAILFVGIGLTAAPVVYADILGFGDGTGFTFATNGVADPDVTAGVATITEEGQTNAAKAST